jgi:excisionase family DNA binding protein
MCNVTQRAVIYWIEKGKLKAYRTPGGHRRIPEDELLDFIRRHNIPVGPDRKTQRSSRVLIVDDDPEFVESVRRTITLQDSRYEVAAAHTGFDAGFLVSRWKPDLVLLDIMLPEMDGFEVCQTLKANPDTADITIVAISALAGDDTRDRILGCGAEEFLPKPFGSGSLIELLTRYVPV